MTHALSRERGNAIPETALVMSLFLMMLYGVVQYAVLGYDQVSADGATFVGAHDTVAQYGNPSSSNTTYTQKVINAVFSGLRGATVSTVANNGSYETDVTMGNTNTGLSGLLPTSMTTVSRSVESSASTANVGTPLGNCATAATQITNGTTGAVTGPAVNLLQGAAGAGSGLFQLTSAGSGAGQVLDLNSGTVTAHLAALQAVQSNFSATSAALAQLSSVLNPGGLGTAISPVLALIANPISTAVQPLVSAALTGKLTQSQLNAATTTLSGLNTLISTTLGPAAPAFTAALYGGGGKDGLLGGPNGGTLMLLNASEQAVQTIDAAAPAHC